MISDRIGPVLTLLLGSFLQMVSLTFFLPFSSEISLYVVSLMFGLSQGGIVPAYAIIIRKYLPIKEAGLRVGSVIGATIVGMSLGVGCLERFLILHHLIILLYEWYYLEFI